jgi:Ca-activated chloride channel family protein
MLAGLAMVLATGASAAEPPAVIVIADASRSMWGTLEGSKQTKLTLLREALRGSLGKIGPQTRIGVAAFGHRRPSDCNDVEVMRAPDTADADRIMTPLDQLSPRGVGPLTLALREAAKALPREANRRSLVLVHDDADNCQPDAVCAAAAELRSAGIIVHVVGLANKAQDHMRMACLPQITGGRHFNAQNAEQAVAFVEEAVRLAGEEAGGDRVAKTVAGVPPPPMGATGLHLRAQLAANAEVLGVPLRWVVTSEAQPNTVLFDAVVANPAVPVPPGRYVVEVRDALVSARQAVEVSDSRPVGVPVVLGAGAIRVGVTAQKSAAPLKDAIVSITRAGGSGAPVAVVAIGETTLLPAGRYVVRAELGLVVAEEAVTVTAGPRPVNVDLRLNVARLQLSAASRDGGVALDTPIFIIARDDADLRGRREVARSSGKVAEFVLPPDTYYVIVRQGSIESTAQLAIGPGEIKKHTLTVQAGRLALSTKALGARAELVSYTVDRIDDPSQESLVTSRPEPMLVLPAGRYRVEGRVGSTNVSTVRDVEVRPGQTQHLVFEHQAATLRLRFASGGFSDTFWDIRDENGRSVWMSVQPGGFATLQPGRYSVQAETRDKIYRARAVDLRAGDAKVIEFVVD